jgi:hypothetical protein
MLSDKFAFSVFFVTVVIILHSNFFGAAYSRDSANYVTPDAVASWVGESVEIGTLNEMMSLGFVSGHYFLYA